MCSSLLLFCILVSSSCASIENLLPKAARATNGSQTCANHDELLTCDQVAQIGGCDKPSGVLGEDSEPLLLQSICPSTCGCCEQDSECVCNNNRVVSGWLSTFGIRNCQQLLKVPGVSCSNPIFKKVLSSVCPCECNDGILQLPPTVKTSCGRISGALDNWGDKGSIARFAVPFALPPTGDLRWRPPVPAQCPWSGTYNGSFVPNSCIDIFGTGSEDCLYLNLLVPVKNNQFPPAKPLPVVAYFHGGSLVMGSAPGEIIGSENFALSAPRDGLIVVTVPYRLNLMGWLATADLAEEQGGHSGNYGLQDAILALKWIQNNIASFGGDPKRVTLLGESSGGTMIFGLFASPAAAGLFAGGISLSGSPNMTENAVGKWAQDQVIVESNSECSQPGTAAERLACLRQLDAASVAQATPSEWTTPDIFGWLASPSGTLNPPAAGGIGYTAAIYVDGLTIPLPFDQALAAGINSQASLVISNMVAEPDGIQPIASALHSAPNDLWPRLLQRAFASWPNIESAVPTVMNLYQEEIDIGGVQLAYDAFVSDYGLTCANLKVGATAVSSGLRNAPTYLLYNAWPSSSHSEDGTGQWPYHGQDWAEIQALWSDFPPQTSDLIVSALLMTLVTDFAYNSGVMPDNWNWSPLQKDLPPQTFVVAQDTVYPSGGVRAETNWRADRCAVLEALGLDQQYWWVN